MNQTGRRWVKGEKVRRDPSFAKQLLQQRHVLRRGRHQPLAARYKWSAPSKADFFPFFSRIDLICKADYSFYCHANGQTCEYTVNQWIKLLFVHWKMHKSWCNYLTLSFFLSFFFFSKHVCILNFVASKVREVFDVRGLYGWIMCFWPLWVWEVPLFTASIGLRSLNGAREDFRELDKWKHSLSFPSRCILVRFEKKKEAFFFIKTATTLSRRAETGLHTEPPSEFFVFCRCHYVARGQRR